MDTIGQGFVGSNPEKTKPKFESYQTPRPVTKAFVLAEQTAMLAHGDAIHEPASGQGAMVDVLQRAGFSVIATDLQQDCFGTGGIDFLTTTEKRAPLLITNPPFTLTGGFLRHAIALGYTYVALLGKAQFWHAQNRDALWDLWRPARIYALTWRPDFSLQGGAMMDCAWTVWDANWHGETVYRRLARPPTT